MADAPIIVMYRDAIGSVVVMIASRVTHSPEGSPNSVHIVPAGDGPSVLVYKADLISVS